VALAVFPHESVVVQVLVNLYVSGQYPSVLDSENSTVRELSQLSDAVTVAGSGTSSQLTVISKGTP